MKPFDLKAALQGDPVVTRDGKPVTQITKFDVEDGYDNIAGVLDGGINTWNGDGSYYSFVNESVDDLFMAPKKRTVWVNLYPNGYAYYYESQALADEKACPDRTGNKAYPTEIEE